jgi:hypothetical protein
MRSNTSTCIISSPEGLKAQLATLKIVGKDLTYINLIIYGQGLFVHPFSSGKTSVKDIKNLVEQEATKTFSLSKDKLVYDYQVLKNVKDRAEGLWAGIPKDHIRKYFALLDQSKLFPLQIVPYVCASLNAFMMQYKDKMEASCFLDLSKPEYIYFASFNQQNVEIIRQIHYENTEEAKREIIQSLRSAMAKSNIKKFEHIYLVSKDGEEEIISFIESSMSSRVEKVEIDVAKGIEGNNRYYQLNAAKDLTFTLPQRRMLLTVGQGVVALLFLLCVISTAKIVWLQNNIGKIKKSYTQKDYDYAVTLKERLK